MLSTDKQKTNTKCERKTNNGTNVRQVNKDAYSISAQC